MKHLLAVMLLALFAGALACNDDDPVTPPVTPGPTFQDRSEKWHVLNNLELAYNMRNITRYDALLDENFTFYLTDKDVVGGLPAYWGRAEEVTLSQHLLSKQPPESGPRCTSIKLDIQFDRNLAWVEATQGDETWYTATCYVSFEFVIDPDIKFVSNTGTQAQFVVRNAGTDLQPEWTLVEMHDRGAPSGPSAVAAGAAATEPATWGHVKALFL